MYQYSALIVDDDVKVGKLLRSYFEDDGFDVQVAHEGSRAMQLFQDSRSDIVILDWMLPDIDGLEICRQIRQASDVPILMLSAKNEESNRLIGLEIGADDYVTKPFSPREVVARAKAILRRTHKVVQKPALIKVGELSIDIKRHLVQKNNIPLDLTPTEMSVLTLLLANRDIIVTRLQLSEYIHGSFIDGYERTIDAHVKNLRRKLEKNPKEPRYIQTVYGLGYKFISEVG